MTRLRDFVAASNVKYCSKSRISRGFSGVLQAGAS
jgi:hypothetical protein